MVPKDDATAYSWSLSSFCRLKIVHRSHLLYSAIVSTSCRCQVAGQLARAWNCIEGGSAYSRMIESSKTLTSRNFVQSHANYYISYFAAKYFVTKVLLPSLLFSRRRRLPSATTLHPFFLGRSNRTDTRVY